MTKPELARRMKTCKYEEFMEGIRLVRQGNGRIELLCNLNTKQANAAHEWVRRYGVVNPWPYDFASTPDTLAVV